MRKKKNMKSPIEELLSVGEVKKLPLRQIVKQIDLRKKVQLEGVGSASTSIIAKEILELIRFLGTTYSFSYI